MKDQNKTVSFPLFEGTDISVFDMKEIEIIDFSPSQDIILPSGIGLILSGNVYVYSREGNLPLNVIYAGGMFGMSTLFNGGSTADSRLSSGSKSVRIAFMKEDSFARLLSGNERVLKNYLGIVSKRICFLSGKVGTFSSQSAEEKLLHHIMQNGGSITVKSMTQLSLMLSMGRASLYRAITVLEDEGKIKREGKTLTLI